MNNRNNKFLNAENNKVQANSTSANNVSARGIKGLGVMFSPPLTLNPDGEDNKKVETTVVKQREKKMIARANSAVKRNSILLLTEAGEAKELPVKETGNDDQAGSDLDEEEEASESNVGHPDTPAVATKNPHMLEEVDRVISSYTVASARDFVKTTTSGDILAYRKISGKCQKVKECELSANEEFQSEEDTQGAKEDAGKMQVVMEGDAEKMQVVNERAAEDEGAGGIERDEGAGGGRVLMGEDVEEEGEIGERQVIKGGNETNLVAKGGREKEIMIEETDAELARKRLEADKHVWPTERNHQMINNPYKTYLTRVNVKVDGRSDMEHLVVFARSNSPVNYSEILVEQLGQNYSPGECPGDSSLDTVTYKRVKQLCLQILRSSPRRYLNIHEWDLDVIRKIIDTVTGAWERRKPITRPDYAKGIEGWGVVLSTPAYEQSVADDAEYCERLEERAEYIECFNACVANLVHQFFRYDLGRGNVSFAFEEHAGEYEEQAPANVGDVYIPAIYPSPKIGLTKQQASGGRGGKTAVSRANQSGGRQAAVDRANSSGGGQAAVDRANQSGGGQAAVGRANSSGGGQAAVDRASQSGGGQAAVDRASQSGGGQAAVGRANPSGGGQAAVGRDNPSGGGGRVRVYNQHLQRMGLKFEPLNTEEAGGNVYTPLLTASPGLTSVVIPIQGIMKKLIRIPFENTVLLPPIYQGESSRHTNFFRFAEPSLFHQVFGPSSLYWYFVMEVMVKKDLFFVADSVIFKPNRTEEEILEFPKLMILALLVGSCQDPIHIWVVFVLEGPNEGTIQLYRECRNQPSEYNKIDRATKYIHGGAAHMGQYVVCQETHGYTSEYIKSLISDLPKRKDEQGKAMMHILDLNLEGYLGPNSQRSRLAKVDQAMEAADRQLQCEQAASSDKESSLRESCKTTDLSRSQANTILRLSTERAELEEAAMEVNKAKAKLELSKSKLNIDRKTFEADKKIQSKKEENAKKAFEKAKEKNIKEDEKASSAVQKAAEAKLANTNKEIEKQRVRLQAIIDSNAMETEKYNGLVTSNNEETLALNVKRREVKTATDTLKATTANLAQVEDLTSALQSNADRLDLEISIKSMKNRTVLARTNTPTMEMTHLHMQERDHFRSQSGGGRSSSPPNSRDTSNSGRSAPMHGGYGGGYDSLSSDSDFFIDRNPQVRPPQHDRRFDDSAPRIRRGNIRPSDEISRSYEAGQLVNVESNFERTERQHAEPRFRQQHGGEHQSRGPRDYFN